MHGLVLITPPASEPVALALAKQHLRLDQDFTDDDQLIGIYISAARSLAEQLTNRAFLRQTWKLTLDHFPFLNPHGNSFLPNMGKAMPNSLGPYLEAIAIRIPKPRLLSVDSITYLDPGGNEQTIDPANYYVDFDSQPARIVPTNGFAWPLQNLYLPGSVAVTFDAGSYVQIQEETQNVPSAAPYQITLSQAANFLSLDSVSSGGTPVTPLSSTDGVIVVNESLAGAAITVDYEWANIPAHVTMALLFMIAHWYTNREATSGITLKEVPLGVQALLGPEKFDRFGF